MSKRETWRPILDAEIAKWSAMSYPQLLAELQDSQSYEVEYEGGKFQVEVELLEKKKEYLHVSIAVDDGSIPASFRPLSASFIKKPPEP